MWDRGVGTDSGYRGDYIPAREPTAVSHNPNVTFWDVNALHAHPARRVHSRVLGARGAGACGGGAGRRGAIQLVPQGGTARPAILTSDPEPTNPRPWAMTPKLLIQHPET